MISGDADHFFNMHSRCCFFLCGGQAFLVIVSILIRSHTKVCLPNLSFDMGSGSSLRVMVRHCNVKFLVRVQLYRCNTWQ